MSTIDLHNHVIPPAIVEAIERDPLRFGTKIESKARDVLGWRPEVEFDELVRLMVDHDLKTEHTKLDRS